MGSRFTTQRQVANAVKIFNIYFEENWNVTS